MLRNLLLLMVGLALLAPAPFAGATPWPQNIQCDALVDEPAVRVTVCVGGHACVGELNVFVCLNPAYCPPGLDDGSVPSDICLGPGAVDADGDGWSVDAGDCNDGDPMVNPGEPEWPDDGMDNNCDGQVDETGP